MAQAQAEEITCADDYGTTFPCPEGKVPAGKEAIFMDNGNGTVTDLRNNMIWEKGANQANYTWKDGVAYCEGLELAGENNWRLPSLEELEKITEFGRSQNVINPIFSCHEGNYWTATPHAASPGEYSTIGYFNAVSGAYPAEAAKLIRCVLTPAP